MEIQTNELNGRGGVNCENTIQRYKELAKYTTPVETNIMIRLESNESYSEISRRLEVTRDKIRQVKAKGKWYVDLDSGERVVSCKNISVAKQVYSLIFDIVKVGEECQQGYNSFISNPHDELARNKSLNARFTTWLRLKEGEIYRWKNLPRLATDNVIRMKNKYISSFIGNMGNIMQSYVNTEGTYISGFKLYYINYCTHSKFSHYINNHCQKYHHYEGSEEAYIKNVVDTNSERNVYLSIMSAKAGIQLSKWCRRKIEEGYTFKECMECLRSGEYYTEFYYEGDLQPPFVIYYETKGFIILPEDIKSRILTQLEGGEIAGTFDYNPMLREIYKLEYG